MVSPPAIPIPSVFVVLHSLAARRVRRGVANEPNLGMDIIPTIETVIQLLSGNELAPRKV